MELQRFLFPGVFRLEFWMLEARSLRLESPDRVPVSIFRAFECVIKDTRPLSPLHGNSRVERVQRVWRAQQKQPIVAYRYLVVNTKVRDGRGLIWKGIWVRARGEGRGQLQRQDAGLRDEPASARQARLQIEAAATRAKAKKRLPLRRAALPGKATARCRASRSKAPGRKNRERPRGYI